MANNSDAVSKATEVIGLLAKIVSKRISVTASVTSALSAIGSVISKLGQLGNRSVSVTAKVNYINNSTKVCIVCPDHGEFWQIPDSHLRGRGCPMCRYIKSSAKVRYSWEKLSIFTFFSMRENVWFYTRYYRGK